MSQQHHLIGRTILELDTGNLADVWSLQEEVSRAFQQQAVPELERLFDRLAGINQVLRFDQVVVEIGLIDRRCLAEELSTNLLAALNQTLNDALLQDARSQENTLIQHSRSAADWEVFLYFLQVGRLPWWVPARNWQNWFSRWEAVIQGNTNWRSSLQRLLARNSAVQQRLVEQFPESFLSQLIVRMQPTWASWFTLLAQARQLMQALRLSRNQTQHLERQAWRLLLVEITPDQTSINPPSEVWLQNWLAQFVYLEATSQQVLQTIRETISSERSLWLTAIEQVFSPLLPEDASLEPLDRSYSDLHLWLFFLEQGRLPQEQSSQDWFPRWEAVMQSDSHWRRSLQTVMATNPTARQRFVDQFPEPFRHQFILQMQPMWNSWTALLTQARQVMQALNLSETAIQHLEVQAWLLLLIEIGSSTETLRPLPTALWIRNWLTQLMLTIDLQSEIRSVLEATIIEDSALWLTAFNQVTEHHTVETTLLSILDRESSLQPEELESGLYVTQAGLVLLHPFLSFYFDAVGLLENDTFRDALSQQSAIYLLHYLVTQQTDAPEYELVLPKLLCGWSLNRPVVRGLELSIAALQEGEHLLQTAIDYWEVLKSTSPDGLREGFLQRQGKLTRTSEGNWKLQVEQNAIDILLSSLPWGLSMVKLPWMEDLLTVEWT
ncbi:hypothetical protein IQ250_15145 [Pseudanabaenaceae cyanobacterium LEGE 13415]|nr:hypothetical protein [Pseudanabaenaceae cyanobacterium LEGE 13415]